MPTTLEQLIKQGENNPFYKLLNIKIEDVKDSFARLSIEISKKHIQLLGSVHGGVMASLADSAAAWAIYGSGNLNGVPVTIEMKINFLHPIKSGKLIAEARTIHRGSRIFVGDVEVKNNEGLLLAKSIVTYYIIEKKEGSRE